MKLFLSKYVLYISIIGLLALNSSCSRRPKEVLKPSEMTKVLVDLHIVDGTLTAPELKKLSDEEKSQYYQSVLLKHNTNQAQFDSSIVWYSHDPKQFEKIYNRVLVQLTKYEEDVKNGKYISLAPKDTLPHFTKVDIWNQPTQFEFNKNRDRNKLHFVIKDTLLMTQDSYWLSFRQRIQTTDTCGNQRAVLYIHYADDTPDSVFKNLQTDGNLRKYTLRFTALRAEKIDSLSGYLLASDECPKALQSAYVDSISLIRLFDSSAQEKLQKEVDLSEKLRTTPYLLFKIKRGDFYSFMDYQ